MKAVWNDLVLAESDVVEVVDGRTYFPPQSVAMDFLSKSNVEVGGGWKGMGIQYHLIGNGGFCRHGAVSFPAPKPTAYSFDGYFCFCDEVTLTCE